MMSVDSPDYTVRAKRANTSIKAIGERRRTRKNASHNSLERGLVRLGVTNTNVLIGADDLSGWDDEELRRGQKRDHTGAFRGKPPVVVPKVIHNELVRRTLSKAEELMRENLYGAIEAIVEIAKDPEADARDRIAAAKIIMDRILGKEAVKVEVTEKKRWELALEGGIVSLSDDPNLQPIELDEESYREMEP